MTPNELRDFEQSIADAFNRAEIPYPIHLSGGNEQQLIDIFKDFKKGDFCFSSWRNHLHALLAGIPPEEVRRQIFAGRSMTVCSPEHNFFSSAIVGGCIPIALGVAWQLKKNQKRVMAADGSGYERGSRVWLFLGDMSAMSGMAYECANYAQWHDLELYIVCEDNGKSVCTNTKEAWGRSFQESPAKNRVTNIDYQFDLSAHWPHSGAGRRIQF